MEKTILTEEKQSKINALANFLEVEPNEITEDEWRDNAFICGNEEYAVYTDKQADLEVADAIKESLWAFNSDFIISHCKGCETMTDYELRDFEKSLNKLQGELCETLNPIILALIEDFDDFVEDAVMCDGRGHFLALYDCEENEQDGFYIYRVD